MLRTATTATTAPVAKSTTSISQEPTQIADDEHSRDAPIKMERRDSTTSESSLEHLDLGRTPKKLNVLSSATSTPHVGNGSSNAKSSASSVAEPASQDTIESLKPQRQLLHHDSDEANDYDDEESADEKLNSSRPHRHHHHKRRSSGRLDKRSVQLELNAENPNSLRKKFRFNRSAADANCGGNNESGFVDGSSSSSQLLNASTTSQVSVPATQQAHHSPRTSGSQSSSASSSPHGADASTASSPESGLGERDDMKFVCPICEDVSATPHEFTNHIRCHNYSSGDTENFTCRICSKVLSSASSLDRHVLVHTGERPFNCKYCPLTFTTNGNMHRHMRTHKQHQHNHHHRRNSNGTAAKHSTATQSAAAAGTVPPTPASTGAQLTNGVGGEGVKAAAAPGAPTPTGAPNGAGANGRRFNGGGSGGGAVESYESDGGCSTDSSSAISRSSNNHNNNNIKTNNNNNNININNNNNNNNNNKTMNTSNNFKRKNCDNLDEDITLMKRRVKTTINNNTIGASDEHHFETGSDAADEQASQPHWQQQCPVCNASDFDSVLALSAHMDSEHCDIPAKCRHCDVVFHTHRQLNVHPCSSRSKITAGFKDLTFVDFSSEKFPLIAKSLCEQSLRSAVTSQKFECQKCGRAFPCASAVEMHERECQLPLKLFGFAENAPRMKQRSVSENSGCLEEGAEEQQRREEFFNQLFLRNKSGLSRSMTSLSPESPDHSMDEAAEEIKYEPDNDKFTQQSHDSKDLADIQSILNMTSSSSTSNFLKNFEQSVNTPSSNYGLDKDEEEAQDAFTSEFRKMKLRGEFPCKLCTAVFPNLRALKGHNRIHLSSVGPTGPFRCNMCPYTICDKAALVRHMRTHNGDRPYECAVCNYAFTTKANCERHLRNRHAKTTRDDVKRAIIYHPSEDSSCDDPAKKLHLFSSPEFDDDIELQYQHHQPKDRSTPVSHLKEMLTCDIGSSKAMKIQVKSLEQLLDKSTNSSTYSENFEERPRPAAAQPSETAPMDLSMDVLDLSRKPTISENPSEQSMRPAPARDALDPMAPVSLVDPKFDISALEKNQQYLLAQQQLINDALPKIVDPAHYFQQLYRNLVFTPINPLNPFFLQNSFLPNNLSDLQKYAPLMNRMLGASQSSASVTEAGKSNVNSAPHAQSVLLPQVSPLLSDKSSVSSLNSSSPVSANHIIPKSLVSSTSSPLNIPRHPHMPQTSLQGGPVKMVIKNGVLMPKQKQRRYRTERPFACEHCSARFTLRSNMERHVKQQHPQFYAQRQRNGHHVMRGRGANNAAAMNSINHLHAAIAAHNGTTANVGPTSSISEQVKYAILAQQLKARKDTDLLQQALAHGSSSVAPNHLILGTCPEPSSVTNVSNERSSNTNAVHIISSNANGSMEDDDPKLVIDEDDEVSEIADESYKVDDEPEDMLNECSASVDEQIDEVKSECTDQNDITKAEGETILEQVIKGSANSKTTNKEDATESGPPTMKSMIAQAESVGKFLKEVASSPFKDESQDLVPVSKLVDNATTNSMSFNNYFRPSDVVNHMEQSDEEGLVASGSASESNNSGTEDISSSAEPKKKSAYSLAPNRVSCPYCQRMFPWSSSLRRHILTHTGQKPFKCSHCPLLFTTKSNCDRHLLRKHGNVESAVSVYVPTEDVNEPIPVPKSVEEIEQQQRQREEEERQRKADEALQLEKQRREKELRQQEEQEQEKKQQQLLKQYAAAQLSQLVQTQSGAGNSPKVDANSLASTELPFKCHLCDSSFGERFHCLEHIKVHHAHDFALLLAKGAIDTDPEPNQFHSMEEEEKRLGEECSGKGGKYPDYSNRKVICAFCVRRFWSTEDLRRHMRTHSGERPFQCDICLRKFTLKHSMLRHMKKHNGRHHSGVGSGDPSNAANSGSDLSDDEQIPATNSMTIANTLALRTHKIQELLSKANEWRVNRLSMGEHKENIAEEQNNQSDLIGNLLGISDQGILNKLLSSADEAAKLLGVDK